MSTELTNEELMKYVQSLGIQLAELKELVDTLKKEIDILKEGGNL